MKRPEDLSQNDSYLKSKNKSRDRSAVGDSDVKGRQVRIFLREYPELATPDGLRVLKMHLRQMDAITTTGSDIVTPSDLPFPRSRPPKRERR